MDLDNHPTVKNVRRSDADAARTGATIDAESLRQLALASGAADAGVVELARPGLEPQREEILRNYPWTRTLLSYVVRMAREPVRGPPRSVANLEFHRAGHDVDAIGARVVADLEAMGIRAVNPSMGFPMEMSQTPSHAPWIVSHKPIAVEAGLGHMGIHRNLIHPKFGNFILLGTVLVDLDVATNDKPIDYNPCLECKLCVAACPVGAIAPDGVFNFSSCFTHNYREFLGGFSDWIEQVADARDAFDYRRRINEPETASMWQSLSYGANYKSAYCMAVCPAGEDVIGPYLRSKQSHLNDVVRPLQQRPEAVYVVAGSDADAIARRKFPNKTVKTVASGLRPRTIDGLLAFMPVVFQPNQSKGLNAVFHFKFTGREEREATVTVRNRSISVSAGLIGKCDIRVTADAKTWLQFLAKETGLPLAFVRRRVRIKGDPRLLLAFGKCFPSAGPKHEQVEILPTPSLLRREPPHYRKNDPATGKLRWIGRLTLSEKVQVTPSVTTFRFTVPDGGPVPFRHLPGQFLTLHIAPGGVATRRSYTIASAPVQTASIEITVKRESQGLVSRWLHDELAVGSEVEIEAPNGAFCFTGDEAPHVVLVAGGVGITPMMSITRHLTAIDWPGSIHLILAFRTPAEFIFRDEIAALQAHNSNLRVTATMSGVAQEWDGARGHIDAVLLAACVPDIARHRAHICGPPPMMQAVRQALIALNVPESQIRTEAFGTVKRVPTKQAFSTRPIGRILFQASNTTTTNSAGRTILQAAEDADVFIDNACRSGTCGSCRVKLLAGTVKMPVDEALTGEDKANGYVLACQAEASGDAIVDA